MDPITFVNTSDTVYVTYPNWWEPMYDYIEKVTKTMKLHPQVVTDNNGSDLDEEIYNEELLRI